MEGGYVGSASFAGFSLTIAIAFLCVCPCFSKQFFDISDFDQGKSKEVASILSDLDDKSDDNSTSYQEIVSNDADDSVSLFSFGNEKISASTSSGVQLIVNKQSVVLDNGLTRVTLTNPGGQIAGIQHGPVDNIMTPKRAAGRRGYWDLNWEKSNAQSGSIMGVEGSQFEVITNTPSQVEVSFKATWDSSKKGIAIPLDFDIRYVMQKDKSGVYAYVVFKKEASFPGSSMVGNRFTARLDEQEFNYMYLSDWKNRYMPNEDDFSRGTVLAFKEAVRLVRASNASFDGEVCDKYQYAEDCSESNVYGWVSTQNNVGFWYIFPSHEFQNGGPIKQQLTLHAGPIHMAVFSGGHYLNENNIVVLKDGETWEKIYGPIYLYLNSAKNPQALWEDAKRQLEVETQNWPYDFVGYSNFIKKAGRATVSGRFLVYDSAKSSEPIPASNASIGLAVPGTAGSWLYDSKYYQFWTKADSKGNFVIRNIVPGSYNIYAWVPTVIGEYMLDKTLTISSGENINVNDLVFNPPRSGPTIWEIGVPDRSCAEFFVPSVSALYRNPLFDTQETWRQYGLWDRYSDLYKDGDLVYDVQKNNYTTDWFYAQVCRKGRDGNYKPTTWTVNFSLKNVDVNGRYVLRIAVAASTYARLEIRFNNRNLRRAHVLQPLKGRDNAIARHGAHGDYEVLEITVNPAWLVKGPNSMYLTQSFVSTFAGIMYDYLRLEGPSA